jgi:hypothetical protein
MFNPIIIRSAVYAGLLSNLLAVIVCFKFSELDYTLKSIANFMIWVLVYKIHKKLGSW